MTSKSDYESNWPKLVLEFCDNHIKKLQEKLESGDLKGPRKEKIEANLYAFTRIRAEYAKGGPGA